MREQKIVQSFLENKIKKRKYKAFKQTHSLKKKGLKGSTRANKDYSHSSMQKSQPLYVSKASGTKNTHILNRKKDKQKGNKAKKLTF